MTWNALFARFAALSPVTKWIALAALVGAVALSIVVTMIAHPSKTGLFAQVLAPDQLAEVEQQLAQWNVPFTPLAGNVSVEASRRNTLLLRLSVAGVPHPHLTTTNEALANVGVLTPQAVIDAQTRSGLAGEIAGSLRNVEGVDDASIIIAPAKIADFTDETSSSATASVRLRLRPGARLSRAQLGGVRAFVAASVPGLDPQRVTILDDRGVAIGDEASNEDDHALQTSLQAALDEALGSGVAIVRVHAEYSPTVRETHATSRSPLGPIVRESATESYDGQGRRYEKNDERDDRGSETSDVVSRTDSGALSRLSTAVLVDASARVSLENVRAIAAASVGFDPKRGDVLTVEAIDFHRTRAPLHDVWFFLYGALVPLLPTVAIVLGIVGIARAAAPHLGAIAQRYGDRAFALRAPAEITGYSPAHVRGILKHEPPHAAAAIISALPAATAAAVLELYPQAEREAIVRRMQREHSPLIPDPAEVLGRHA